MEAIVIKCSNYNKYTGLYLKDTNIEKMITKFLLNEILNHVGMSWIICSINKILYKNEENNHPDWFNKGPWYNTAICYKWHGRVFTYFIKNVRTDRYNLMCSIISHDKQQPTYVDDESNGGGIPIPKNATKYSLEELCATLNFIYCWLKLFHHNY